MLKKRIILSLALASISTQLFSAPPLGTDPGVPHHGGWNGKYSGIKSWMLVDAPDGTKSNFCFFSMSGTPKGDIYIGGMDHLTNSVLFKLDHATDTLWYVGDAKSASVKANNWQPGETCEKFHCIPVYIDGKVYVASGDYSPEDSGYLKERGSHLYAYDEATNEFSDLTASEPDGIFAKLPIFAMMGDGERGVVYGIGQPVPRLYAYNIKEKKAKDLGAPSYGVPPVIAADKQYYTCSRYLWQDKNGKVYFTIKPYKNICFYDPNTGTGEFGKSDNWTISNQFSTNIRNGVRSFDGKYHYVADYEGNLYKFSVDNVTFESLKQITFTDTTYYKHFKDKAGVETGTAFRIRSMVITPDDKKIYFLNDEATNMGLFEYDLETGRTILLCKRSSLEDKYLLHEKRYTCHAGQNAWDLHGRFYFSSFYMYPTPDSMVIQTIMTRVDPVRLKVDLGSLPGLTEVTVASNKAVITVTRKGCLTGNQKVLLSIEETINGKVRKHFKTVFIPADSSSMQVKACELPTESSGNKSATVRVVPDANTYVTGKEDTATFQKAAVQVAAGHSKRAGTPAFGYSSGTMVRLINIQEPGVLNIFGLNGKLLYRHSFGRRCGAIPLPRTIASNKNALIVTIATEKESLRGIIIPCNK